MANAGPALARGRAAAESLMVDTCLIRRRTSMATDDLTGQVTPTYQTVYSGKCKVQQSSRGMGHRRDVGEESTVLLRMEVHLPVAGTTGLAEGDEVTITAATNDAELLTKTFRVHDLEHKTFATARRLMVTEVT
jgi:hypothetical protein